VRFDAIQQGAKFQTSSSGRVFVVGNAITTVAEVRVVAAL
jgi:hypothetical protein